MMGSSLSSKEALLEDEKSYGSIPAKRPEVMAKRWWQQMIALVVGLASMVTFVVGMWHLSTPGKASRRREVRVTSVAVKNATVAMPGLLCDEADSALAFYPEDVLSGKRAYPLVVFAPGDFDFVVGWNVETRYIPIMEGIARRGFVVVSPLAAGGWCMSAAIDQRHVVEVARDYPSNGPDAWLWRGVDLAPGAGVLGISMGGLSSLDNAIGLDYVGSAIAISPYWDGKHEMLHGQPRYPVRLVDTPLLFVTGSRDNEAPWWFVEALYKTAPPGVPSALAVLPNRTHHDIRLSPGLILLAGLWFDCTLRADPDACAALGTSGELDLDRQPAGDAVAELEKAWYESNLNGFTPRYLRMWAASWSSWLDHVAKLQRLEQELNVSNEEDADRLIATASVA
mmetsp:Transcript_23427/g.73356  ORF Transcript_23427/g.73356 Transcript_23427/m.73356 type:complete len:396 (+) Transcript_23427:71-1258(+)